jgi:hypothetical protein
MPDIENIFAFKRLEDVIAARLSRLLTLWPDVPIFTLFRQIEIEYPRPRIEVMMNGIAPASMLNIATGPNAGGWGVAPLWRGTLQIAVVTDVNASVHETICAHVRYALCKIAIPAEGENHPWIIDAAHFTSESATYRTEDDQMVTSFTVDLKWRIKPEELIEPEPPPSGG